MIVRFYARAPRLVIDIQDGMIVDIDRCAESEMPKVVRRVEGLEASPYEPIHVDGDRFVLDGLAVLELWCWLVNQRPQRTTKQQFAALERLFRGMHDWTALSDALRAIGTAAAGLEHTEPGEHQFYAIEQIRLHPETMGELRTEWRRLGEAR